MKSEVGIYVRFNNGFIYKTNYIDERNNPLFDFNINEILHIADDVTKASYNIIDLIEVGDYVNGHKVSEVCIDSSVVNNDKLKFGDKDLVLTFKSNHDTYYLYVEDIKSIVTKEQFEEMEYKI